MEKAAGTKNKMFFWINTAIVFIMAFGFGQLSPIGDLTPMGMKVLGIFLGVIYGWTMVDMIWPSLVGIIALASTGVLPMPKILTMSFGSDILPQMLIMFTLMQLINEYKCSNWVANKVLSVKLFHKNLWLLAFGILSAAYLVSLVGGGPWISALLFWTVSYGIFEKCGMKPGDKFPTLMIIGIMAVSCLALIAFPFFGNSIMLVAAFNNMGVGEVDFAKYMLFTIPMAFILIMCYLLFCKYIFRVDLSKASLSQDDKSFVVEAEVLNIQQKWSLALIAAIILINCIPSICPAGWAFTQLIQSIGFTGRFGILMVIAMLIHVDGKPLLDVRTMAAKGVMWEAIYLCAFILPISQLMISPDTGITPFLIKVMTPILGGHSQMVFIILMVLLATVITNFANNVVTCITFMSVGVPFAVQMGLNPVPICVMLIVVTHMAVATPAASPFAPLLFANKEWLKAKDIYFYGGLCMIFWAIVMATFGYAYLNLIF